MFESILKAFAKEVISNIIGCALHTDRLSLKQAATLEALVHRAVSLIDSDYVDGPKQTDTIHEHKHKLLCECSGRLIELIGRIVVEGKEVLDNPENFGLTAEEVTLLEDGNSSLGTA